MQDLSCTSHTPALRVQSIVAEHRLSLHLDFQDTNHSTSDTLTSITFSSSPWCNNRCKSVVLPINTLLLVIALCCSCLDWVISLFFLLRSINLSLTSLMFLIIPDNTSNARGCSDSRATSIISSSDSLPFSIKS